MNEGHQSRPRWEPALKCRAPTQLQVALVVLSTYLSILAKDHGPRFFREKMTGTPLLFCFVLFFWLSLSG